MVEFVLKVVKVLPKVVDVVLRGKGKARMLAIEGMAAVSCRRVREVVDCYGGVAFPTAEA